MVIENPMQFMIVRAEPTYSFGAFVPTSAEYYGESPTTTIPQNTKNMRKSSGEKQNAKGESRQQIADTSS